jgi:lantibiotic modifying enzyme
MPLNHTPCQRSSVLTGHTRATALDVVEDIVTDLSAAVFEDGSTLDRSFSDPFIAIFFAEAAVALERPELIECAVALQRRSAERLHSSPSGIGLHGGICGVAWLTRWLANRQTHGDGADEACAQIDELLVRLVEEWDLEHQDYDLVSGLIGMGVYALRASPTGSARTLLEHIVSRLERAARRADGGTTWLTPPETLPPDVLSQAPAGLFNMGMAHGVPGVIALLSRVHGAGVETERVLRLIEGALRWLQRQCVRHGDGVHVPNWVTDASSATFPRSAWCYGTLGMSAGIMLSDQAVLCDEWHQHAIDMARREAARGVDGVGVMDACLCHGAAGNALVYLQLYASSGDHTFESAARTWYETTLRMRRRGMGIGGYQFMTCEQMSDNASFLSGSAGVGLSLLAALSDHPPSWSDLLLIDDARAL